MTDINNKHIYGPLLTDLYELTMMAGYFAHGRQNVPAVFEYFFRKLPFQSGFCIFAGLEDLLSDLETLRFTDEDIKYLASLDLFTDDFLHALADFRFECDVWSVPEGTLVFPNEPIVRVHGPLMQAQLVETMVLNRLNYQTLVATKAARVCFAAEGDPVYDFGLRRAQGPDGGLSGSRAAFIGGCTGTSNVLAGKHFGIPVSGTQAHSWIMSYPSELESFRAYAKAFPANPLMLVDTYDTLRSGVPNAIKVFTELRERGWKGRAAIRLDSGDLARLSKDAWEMLEKAGFENPLIVGSSDLDEDLIADLKRQGAKINAWGVGTKLITAYDDPALSGVYKISAVEEAGNMVPRLKVSSNPEKTTDPGVKNVVRFYDEQGKMAGDVLLDEREGVPQGPVTAHDRQQFERVRTFPASFDRKELHERVMVKGQRSQPLRSLKEIQAYAKEELSRLRIETQRLRNPDIYYIGLSAPIADAKREAIRRYSAMVTE